MNILGISGYYHDAAAALVSDGSIIAAVEEERFSRKKHDPSFPSQSIKYCLDHAGLSLNQLDAVVFYDKPFLKFERLLETYYDNVPHGLPSFLHSMPVWIKEKLFLKNTLKEELKKIDPTYKPKSDILFTEHHLAHAASAFYPSAFSDAAILTIDGVGEWATASICSGNGNNITVLKELHFPDSVGLLYSSFTYFLGFKVNSGEYKMMGLAPYGNKTCVQTIEFIKLIESELITIYDDGSIRLNKKYFNYSTGLTMIHESKWQKVFQLKRRKPEEKIEQAHCNLAFAIQSVTEQIVMLMAKHAKEITGSNRLCMAGGVALNSVANGRLQRSNLFREIFIQPAAGDSGGALGAAMAAEYIYFNKERNAGSRGSDKMHNSYLGPEFCNKDIERTARKYKGEFIKYSNHHERNESIASYLMEGKVVGVFSGRMEFGPRALGNRSILASPLVDDMQQTLNLKIKFREGFRPFAAVVTEEEAQQFFDCDTISPYMLQVYPVKKEYLVPLPDNYQEMTMEQKLGTKKSVFPAITHADLSCRIQTVNRKNQPALWNLLDCFKKLSGYPLLINTSFNIRGEPIVCTPDEAYECFLKTGMDILVMNNYVFRKAGQTVPGDTAKVGNFLAEDL